MDSADTRKRKRGFGNLKSENVEKEKRWMEKSVQELKPKEE